MPSALGNHDGALRVTRRPTRQIYQVSPAGVRFDVPSSRSHIEGTCLAGSARCPTYGHL